MRQAFRLGIGPEERPHTVGFMSKKQNIQKLQKDRYTMVAQSLRAGQPPLKTNVRIRAKVPTGFIFHEQPFHQENWPLEKGERISTFTQRARCQRIYLTKNRYVGLGRATIRKNYGVCVLFGCRVPVILRKIESYYVFIGPTYLQGWMDGRSLICLRMTSSKRWNFGSVSMG
ncbi:uncharacterized protein CC84DRAFT_803957 [Paraphaeosphaeria sporulosa]|uniref:Uncharacterized protein n=1 Tax=Paraphaeosphaeria sporulosa TaxID=1460663 RepID=A0A177CDG4_9PLEO|nr:uncharacterized protein CC84DRAFT_803957 [Paraphaeosphaeria sporulosa]OAG04808.1 hypothetical protein CC84DRAFT_803957 [Paraphaeosphaeria sporulosa]